MDKKLAYYNYIIYENQNPMKYNESTVVIFVFLNLQLFEGSLRGKWEKAHFFQGTVGQLKNFQITYWTGLLPENSSVIREWKA